MHDTFAGLRDFHVVLEDQFATDDRVVCRWRSGGTHSAELYGLPRTGRRLEWTGISVWQFEGGKARRGWIYADVAGLMAQLT